MSTAVIDSGALLELLFHGGSRGVRRFAALIGREFVAPHLVDPEFLSSVRKLALRGELSAVAATKLVLEFRDAEIERFPHSTLIDVAWRVRDNITPYDAMYVALAQKLGIPLITADGRLARAAAAHCEVELLEQEGMSG